MLAMAGSDWVKAQHVPARRWPATRPCHHPHHVVPEGRMQLLKAGGRSPNLVNRFGGGGIALDIFAEETFLKGCLNKTS